MTDSTSIWKRELHFRRHRDGADGRFDSGENTQAPPVEEISADLLREEPRGMPVDLRSHRLTGEVTQPRSDQVAPGSAGVVDQIVEAVDPHERASIWKEFQVAFHRGFNETARSAGSVAPTYGPDRDVARGDAFIGAQSADLRTGADSLRTEADSVLDSPAEVEPSDAAGDERDGVSHAIADGEAAIEPAPFSRRRLHFPLSRQHEESSHVHESWSQAEVEEFAEPHGVHEPQTDLVSLRARDVAPEVSAEPSVGDEVTPASVDDVVSSDREHEQQPFSSSEALELEVELPRPWERESVKRSLIPRDEVVASLSAAAAAERRDDEQEASATNAADAVLSTNATVGWAASDDSTWRESAMAWRLEDVAPVDEASETEPPTVMDAPTEVILDGWWRPDEGDRDDEASTVDEERSVAAPGGAAPRDQAETLIGPQASEEEKMRRSGLAPAWRPAALPLDERQSGSESLIEGELPVDLAVSAEEGLNVAPEPKPSAPKTPLLKRELRLPRMSARQAGAATDVVGLRIGSTQLAAARIRTVNGRHELVQVAREPLRSGIVVAGEVREAEALALALKSFFDAHALPRKAVRLGVASNRIGVRMLEVPSSGDPALFDNVVRFRAQEVVPIPLAEASLDRVDLEEFATPEGPMRRILVAFAHRDLVNRYAEVCKRAHLKLVGIDFDAFALLRALDEPREAGVAPDRATVAVSIGHERTIFALAEGDVCDFTRVLEWGGSSLNASIAQALNLAPSETAPIKHALVLDGDGAPPSLTPEQFAAARRAIKGELEVVARELLASLQFYQSRPGSLAIGEILLAGGGAQLEGVANELERLIGVPVRLADPFLRVELGKKAEWPAEAGSLAIAVGLGMAA